MNKKGFLLLICILTILLLSFGIVNAKDNATNTKIKEKNSKVVSQEKEIKTLNKCIKTNTKKQTYKNEVSKKVLEIKNTTASKKESSDGEELTSDYALTTKVEKISTFTYNITTNVRNKSGKTVNTGKVRFYVYDESENIRNVEVKQGKANLRYTFDTYYQGVEVFSEYRASNNLVSDFSNTEYFDIEPQDIKININYPQKVYTGNNIMVKTSIKDHNKKVGNNGTVKLYINNKLFKSKKPSNSKAEFNLGKLNKGIYRIKVIYQNDYKEQDNKTAKITVLKIKKEKISMIIPKKLTTDQKTKITVKVTNDTTKLNTGKIKLKLNNKLISSKNVKNGKAIFSIKLPRNSGKYRLSTEYIKGKKLANSTKKVSIKDSEKLKFNIPTKTFPPNTKITLKAKVNSKNIKVNYGKIKFTIDGKTIGNKNVKKGIATVTYNLPKKEQDYTVTATYIKNNKKVQKISEDIYVYYSSYVSLTYTAETEKGDITTFKATAKGYDGKKMNSGKVVFYMDNKKIGTVKVKNGIANLKYKIKENLGDHYIKIVYLNSKNQVDSYESRNHMHVSNKLNVPKGASTMTLPVHYTLYQEDYKDMGTDTMASWYQTTSGEFYPGVYLIIQDKYSPDVPNTYRLLQAKFYYTNYQNGKTITKTLSTKNKIFMIEAPLITGYTPYQVKFTYRKMTSAEKRKVHSYYY